MGNSKNNQEDTIESDGFDWLSEFRINQNTALNNNYIKDLINIISETQIFMVDLSYLSFGRDFTFIRFDKIIPTNLILDSTTRTLESIKKCCENTNFADAYTLLRKYRDDLFYYLYILTISKDINLLENSDKDSMNKHEKFILDWMEDKLSNLNSSEVLKAIGESEYLSSAIKKFNLQSAFKKMGDKLNNFVHSNGKSYYNEPLHRMGEKVEKYSKEFTQELDYITVAFLFLLVLVMPLCVMSYDYVDYLDCGDTPREGSQYWVAPFVQEYLKKHKSLLDENCDLYLKEETGMEFV
ncbi:hypothetical protein [Acetobacterium tundrae]|uniref:Uncharacterized protein n=1 Tax=Acetobacterium tundrae TaxID=132932 RepID=A0ABR6WLI9_9FIRM|nr:hypothetical protein [Acetobacterium tundrae]MBC3797373.1 hypothetical protein [Acetobacterium tundrae]